MMDNFRLLQSADGFNQGVVVQIARRTYRGIYAGIGIVTTQNRESYKLRNQAEDRIKHNRLRRRYSIFIGANPWDNMRIYHPYGKLKFRSVARGRFGLQGETELVLESAEPEFSEVPLDEFLKRFPEGVYQIRAKGLEGEIYVGSARLTHNLPEGPRLIAPPWWAMRRRTRTIPFSSSVRQYEADRPSCSDAPAAGDLPSPVPAYAAPPDSDSVANLERSLAPTEPLLSA